jgi:hypothetical protein
MEWTKLHKVPVYNSVRADVLHRDTNMIMSFAMSTCSPILRNLVLVQKMDISADFLLPAL